MAAKNKLLERISIQTPETIKANDTKYYHIGLTADAPLFDQGLILGGLNVIKRCEKVTSSKGGDTYREFLAGRVYRLTEAKVKRMVDLIKSHWLRKVTYDIPDTEPVYNVIDCFPEHYKTPFTISCPTPIKGDVPLGWYVYFVELPDDEQNQTIEEASYIHYSPANLPKSFVKRPDEEELIEAPVTRTNASSKVGVSG